MNARNDRTENKENPARSRAADGTGRGQQRRPQSAPGTATGRTQGTSSANRPNDVSRGGTNGRQRTPVTETITAGGPAIQKVDFEDHRIVRDRKNIDYFLLVIILLLVGIGIAAVASASFPEMYVKQSGDGYYLIRKHLTLFLPLGLGALAVIAAFFDLLVFKKLAVPAFIFVLILLLLVWWTPLGVYVNGAKRWLDIGPLRLQPSEFMKLALPMLLAWYYDLDKSKRWKYVVPASESDLAKPLYFFYIPLLIIGIAIVPVVFEPHLSGSAIIAAIGWFVMLFYRPNWRLWVLPPLGYIAVKIYAYFHPYAKARLEGNLAQTQYSVTAIGSGGLFGVGYGNSRMKYSYITEAENDFVFSVWCEEMGLIGALIVIVLFALFVWRGYEIARRAPDRFSSLLAYGIVTQVGLQALLNIAVVSDVFSNTGISLPFISYGGTSFISLLAEMGILLAISRHTYHKESLSSAPKQRLKEKA